MTRLRFIYSYVRGEIVHDALAIHEKYGEIVRVAPNELSFAKAEAWTDIFTSRLGAYPFPKNSTFYTAPVGAQNIVTETDPVEHARMRKLFASAFTEQATKAQEGTVQYYTNLLVARLKESAVTPDGEGGIIDIMKWLNCYTFDVIGDLGFGEPFGCLEKGQYHPWIDILIRFAKGMIYLAAARYYPWVEYLLMKCVLKSVTKMHQDHHQLAVEKMNRRLNLETIRNDFITPVIEKNSDFKSMSIAEVEATSAIFIAAGSETTGTTLCGTVNYLTQNPLELEKLVAEIRSAFPDESEINLAAVKELPFLDAVIHEGLRLCNPIPGGLPRIVPKGGSTVCGHFIPEYTNLYVNPTALSHSSRNFFRAASFLPARWLPPSSRPTEFDNDRREVEHPFSLGSRGCIGKNMAWAQMRMVLAKLVWHFDMDVVEEERVHWPSIKTYMVPEKRPVKIRFKARAHSQL